MTNEDADDAPHYQDFILQRELAEVYLLLDNLSGSASKDLEDDSEDAPKVTGRDRQPKDWIEAVCEIAWPPHGTSEDEAHDIGTLIRVRDYLNRRAAPANGSTIAFTLLVAGEGRADAKADREAKKAAQPDEAKPGAAAPPPKKETEPRTRNGRGWRGREPPSRVELANLAFPNLSGRAQEFKNWIWGMATVLIVSLVATCALSWNVAAGNALLTQLTAAQADQAQIETQINAAENGDGSDASEQTTTAATKADPLAASAAPLPGSPGGAGIAPTPPPPSPPQGVRYCDRTAASASAAGGSLAAQLRLCDMLADKQTSVNAATLNLVNWSRSWMFLDLLSVNRRGCGMMDGLTCPQAATEQWVTSLLGVLTGGVLPIFYGFLGAGAAVVRSLSAKLRDWQLAPRDRQLSVIQLALGAVIGACIGLFVTPAGASGGAVATGAAAAASQGLLGPVHLSASALCFIAGFFVEGVFVALEGLMRRVFNISDPSQKPSR